MHKHISKHPETQHLPSDVVHYREYKILLKPDRPRTSRTPQWLMSVRNWVATTK